MGKTYRQLLKEVSERSKCLKSQQEARRVIIERAYDLLRNLRDDLSEVPLLSEGDSTGDSGLRVLIHALFEESGLRFDLTRGSQVPESKLRDDMIPVGHQSGERFAVSAVYDDNEKIYVNIGVIVRG